MKTLSRVLVGVAGSTVLAFGSMLPANAAGSTLSQTSTTTERSQSCVEQIEAIPGTTATDLSFCDMTTTTELGDERPVSVADIQAESELSKSEKKSLVAAAAAGTVRSKHYSKFVTGGAYTVTQNGTFYYDGSRAWATKPYRGYQGTQNCFVNYAVGASITTNSCSDSGTNARRDMWYRYTVSVAFKGSPVSYGYSLKQSLYANGSTS